MTASCRFRLLALDIDGTVSGPDGKVPDRTMAALHAAAAAGLRVVPCTGRSLGETIGGLDPALCAHAVVVGGAQIWDTVARRSMRRQCLPADDAHEVTQQIVAAGQAPLVLVDRLVEPLDYWASNSCPPPAHFERWFRWCELRVQRAESVDEMSFDNVLRISAFGGDLEALKRLGQQLNAQGRSGIRIQDAKPVVAPDDAGPLFGLSLFAAAVDKWSAIAWLARQLGIAAAEIVAIGDSINDIPLFRQVGCAVAMDDAPAEVHAAAHRRTASAVNCGVADAIDNLLSGAW